MASATDEQIADDVAKKGYDPSIPLEDRTPEEKDATIAEMNAPKPVGQPPKAKAKQSEAKASARKQASDERMKSAVAALKKAKGPMHNRDLAAALTESYDPFYLWLKGHPEVFVKTAPGVFDLKERNPKGEARPLHLANGKPKPVEAKPEPKAKAAAKTPSKAAAKSKGSSSRSRTARPKATA